MVNVVIYSKNNDFSTDLASQINSLGENYTSDNNQPADILVFDEDTSLLDSLRQKNDRMAVFVLLGKGAKKQPDTPFIKYLMKPIVLSSFLDMLKSSLNMILSSQAGILTFNGYELSPLEKEIKNLRTGKYVKLTEREVQMLLYLHKAKDKITTKSDLLKEVWGYSPDVSTHTIETHIYRLRQKVEKDDTWPMLISTENGGYRLVCP